MITRLRSKGRFAGAFLAFALTAFHPPALAKTAVVPRTTPMVSSGLEQLHPASRKAWLKHLAQVKPLQPLQAGCDPYYLAPAASDLNRTSSKGAVILLHGFTACSQQNDRLAPRLAQAGYHVFVPRLPGHGLPATFKKGVWHDNLDTMPQGDEAARYQQFAALLPELVRHEKGIRAIAGVSLGGTLAASAVLQAPRVFQRVLLMTPVFDIAPPQNYPLPLLNQLVPQWRLHWGKTCDLERSKNRGGYCEFAIAHVRGMQQFGENTFKQLKNLDTRVQIVGVEGDGAASNPALLGASKRVPFGEVCLYKKGSSHSMLSPYDNQHENKFWVPFLESQIIKFINEGAYFEQVKPAIEQGFMQCRSAF